MAGESEDIYIYIRSEEGGLPLFFAGAVRAGGTVRFLNERSENVTLYFPEGAPFYDTSQVNVVPTTGALIQTVNGSLTGTQNFDFMDGGRHLLLVVAGAEEGPLVSGPFGPVNVVEKIDFVFEGSVNFGLAVYPPVEAEATALNLLVDNHTAGLQVVGIEGLSSEEVGAGDSTSFPLPLEGPYPRNYRLGLAIGGSSSSKFPVLEAGGTDYVVIIVDP